MGVDSSNKGKFIVFEGGDGVGKSTQAYLLVDALTGHNIDAIYMREPGSTVAGDMLRKLLKDKTVPLTERAQLMVICAARAQLIEETLRPALAKGQWVILDRYLPSTIAYRPTVDRLVFDLLNHVLDVPTPDVYVFLTANIKTVLGRVKAKDTADRFDNQDEATIAERLRLYSRLVQDFDAIEIDTSHTSIQGTHIEVLRQVMLRLDGWDSVSRC